MAKILIITEAGPHIGAGHMTRCEGLALQLKIEGAEVDFVINDYAAATERLRRSEFDGAIIDSYRLEEKAYFEVYNQVNVGLYIDDYKRMDYPPGIVLNGSIGAQDLDYPKSSGIIYLLGPRYMPMRPDFVDVAPRCIVSERINRIFIAFGGEDRFGRAVDISAFILKEFPDISQDVVLGGAVPSDKMPKADKQAKIVYHHNLDAADMISIMQKCDVAISAGGQTLYELARTGAPTIGICTVENQLNNLRGWEDVGFLKYCGWYNEPSIFQNIKSAVLKMQDKAMREKMSKIGQRFVDGKGAQRVAERIRKAIHENVKSQ